MIRINLLPQKKTRKADPGQQQVLIGLMVVIGMFIAIWLLVHKPLQDKITRMDEVNATLRKKNKKLKQATKNFEQLDKAFKAAQQQQEGIERLRSARAVPAWMLKEISTILTKDGQPTMTPKMAKKVMEDPNRAWQDSWDPKRVWIISFAETRGRFKLSGGAQQDDDMTQLALRMQASVYFQDVIPQAGSERVEKGTGVSYYNFTITGKVSY